jgi:hypothetical protein
MTEGDAGPDRGRRMRLLVGRTSCVVALLLGVGQIFASLQGAGANASAGILGIAFCILGYFLDSRKLATAAVFLCTAAVIGSMSAFQLVS